MVLRSRAKREMNYRKLFLFICIICPLVSLCQKKDFVLKVHFDNPYAKTLFIGEAYLEELKPFNAAIFKVDSAIATNNDYIFEGKNLYPTAVRLMSFTDSLKFSQLIFIDTGYQEINIIKVNNEYIAQGNSSVEKEHKEFLEEMNIKDIDEKIPGEKLFAYIKANPNSYVGLFALINQTFNYSYSAIFRKIISVFSDEIKQTQGLEYYKSLYLPDKKIGNYLVFTENKKPVELNFINNENKFTFLEFWFKGCVGCQEELEKIKGLYSESLRKKLNIIGISTDSGKYFDPSRKYIKEQKVPWKNYWDWDGEIISKFTFIYVYPSNLLINSSGKIIAKDVDFTTIDEYLK